MFHVRWIHIVTSVDNQTANSGIVLRMIIKIISDGQTGVGRAALDTAIKLDIPYSGSIPKDRKTEDGSLPDTYILNEMPTFSYAKSAKLNIVDSDGTLFISNGQLTATSRITFKLAEKYHGLYLHIDLNETPAFQAGMVITSWITKNDIQVLHVTGPWASEDPKIYETTLYILESVYYLGLVDKQLPDPKKSDLQVLTDMPKSLDEAVRHLMTHMPLKDRVTVANMAEIELTTLHQTLGRYIRHKFGLWTGNEILMDSCRLVGKIMKIDANIASEIIIGQLWKGLKKTHKLRILK